MKIQKITQPATFQPVVLEITIETQEEYDALTDMAGVYIAGPAAMVEDGQLEAKYLSDAESFFYNLREAL